MSNNSTKRHMLDKTNIRMMALTWEYKENIPRETVLFCFEGKI
jgi:hypothetical protein